jgi:hypothetical protein
MTESQKKKEEAAASIKSLEPDYIELYKQMGEAESAKDMEKYGNLYMNFLVLETEVERLDKIIADAEEEEARPEKERIANLEKELATSPYPSFYEAAQGGADVFLSRDLPENQLDPVALDKRQREIMFELTGNPVTESRFKEMLPAGVRFGVGALPTPASEVEYLQRTYPESEITGFNVAGKPEYLIKNKDGSILTTLDKGISGTMGALSVEGPITVGETVAGVGTTAMTRSPMAGNLAASGTRLALGTAADAITRAALQMPQDSKTFGESLMRRGSEAAIGAALGTVTDVAIPATIAARRQSKFANEFLRSYEKPVKRLGLPASAVPPGAQFGPRGLDAAQQLAGEFQDSLIANTMRSTQESARTIFNAWKSGVPVDPSDFRSIAVNLDGQRRALKNSIRERNFESQEVIDNAFDRLLTPPERANVYKFGEFIESTIRDAENKASNLVNTQYDEMAKLADQAGFAIEAKQLINLIPQIKRSISPGGFVDDSAVKSIEDKLIRRRMAPDLIEEARKDLAVARSNRASATSLGKQSRYDTEIQVLTNKLKDLNKINRPLDFKSFNELIREFGNLRSDNVVGGTTKDIFGNKISNDLSKLRNNIFSRYSATDASGVQKNLGEEFEKARTLVDNRGSYERNSLGYILREVGGEQATTPREIAREAMKEPFTMNRVLQAAKDLEIADRSKAGIADNLRNMMKVQYLDDIGMGTGKKTARLDYDPSKLEVLYGPEAPKIQRGLDSINEQLGLLKKADTPKMTLMELNKFSSALSKKDRDDLAKSIIARSDLESQQEELVRNKIYKLARSGNFKNVDADALAATYLHKNTTPAQAEEMMKQLSKLSPEARNLFKGDLNRAILDRYPGGEFSAGPPHVPLFDTGKFIADYNPGTGLTRLGQKIKIGLGDGDADFLFDLAKVYEGNKIVDVAAKNVNPRFIASKEGLNAILPLSQIAGPLRRRYLAAVLGTGADRHGLRNALAKNALPGDVNDAYVRMFKNAFLTRQGFTALANQAKDSPEFTAELVRTAKEFQQQEELNSAEE